ncbi:MAG: glycosyltransferase [Candidatus Bathyarchaeota archaeon]|jgi:glycosyltransferase involved in cell wall biosynthesis
MSDVTLIGNTLNTMGGGERVTAHMLMALKETGHYVTLRTWDRPDFDKIDPMFHGVITLSNFVDTVEPLGLNFIQLGNVRETDVLSWLRRSHQLYKGDALVVNSQGNTVPAYSHISYIHFPTFALLHPALKEIADQHLSAYVSSNRDSMMMRVRQFLYKNLLERSIKVLANSTFTKKYLDRVVSAETGVLYPPVEVEEISRAAGVMGDREDLVLTISHIRRDKRLELVPEIASRVEGARFHVVGHPHDTEYHHELVQLTKKLGIEDRVSFETDFDRSDLLDILVKAKVYLHTMPYEHFGISPVEAMAAGLVPVVHRSGGPYHDILDGKQGIYGYAYEGVIEAVDQIEKLLHEESLRTEIAEKCMERSKFFSSPFFRKGLNSTVDCAKALMRDEVDHG